MRDQTGQRPPVGAPSRHSSSPRTLLLRAGFQNATRAGALLDDPALVALLPTADTDRPDRGRIRPSADSVRRPGGRPGDMELGPGREDLIEALALTADPDLALLNLVRLAEASAAAETRLRACELGAEPGCTRTPAALLHGLLTAADKDTAPSAGGDDSAELLEFRRRLLAVLGASQALGDFLVAHPDRVTALAPTRAWAAPGEPSAREALRRAVQDSLDGATAPEDGSGSADPADRGTGVDCATAALRRAYRDRLMAIVADDLTSPDPIEQVPTVCRRMAELADAALDAALLIARAAVGPQAD